MTNLPDPYVIPGTNVLKNKWGIKNLKELMKAETDQSVMRMRYLSLVPLEGNYDFNHFQQVHRFLFGKAYEWAGEPRAIDIYKCEKVLQGYSIEYEDCTKIEESMDKVLTELKTIEWGKLSADDQAKCLATYMARVWKIHAFREGNTRTTTTFFCQFAESKGMVLNRLHFAQHSKYLRDALVAASASWESIGDRSKPEYLIKFVKDGIARPAKGKSIHQRMEQAKGQTQPARKDEKPHEREGR